MSDAKTERARADKIEQAMAQAAAPAMAKLTINLPSGRVAFVEFPMPLAPDEAMRVAGAFITAYLQALDAEMRKTAGGRIIIPT